jgi:hypothetical protein
MTDKRIRQAVQAALDMEPIMAAGFGDKAFYRVDPGLMHRSSRSGIRRPAVSTTTRRIPRRRRSS